MTREDFVIDGNVLSCNWTVPDLMISLAGSYPITAVVLENFFEFGCETEWHLTVA